MEPWGVHSFENDDAREWANAYREMGLFVAKSTIEVALGDFKNSGLQADVAARAVAAVEAVAFALGRGSAEAEAAFQGAPDADPAEAEALIPLAEEALAAIGGGSGLRAHWKETSPQDFAGWEAALGALNTRLLGEAETGAPEDAEAAPAPAATPAAAPTTAPGAGDAMAEMRESLRQLSTEVQALRGELRAGLRALSAEIGGQGR